MGMCMCCACLGHMSLFWTRRHALWTLLPGLSCFRFFSLFFVCLSMSIDILVVAIWLQHPLGRHPPPLPHLAWPVLELTAAMGAIPHPALALLTVLLPHRHVSCFLGTISWRWFLGRVHTAGSASGQLSPSGPPGQCVRGFVFGSPVAFPLLFLSVGALLCQVADDTSMPMMIQPGWSSLFGCCHIRQPMVVAPVVCLSLWRHCEPRVVAPVRCLLCVGTVMSHTLKLLHLPFALFLCQWYPVQGLFCQLFISSGSHLMCLFPCGFHRTIEYPVQGLFWQLSISSGGNLMCLSPMCVFSHHCLC